MRELPWGLLFSCYYFGWCIFVTWHWLLPPCPSIKAFVNSCAACSHNWITFFFRDKAILLCILRAFKREFLSMYFDWTPKCRGCPFTSLPWGSFWREKKTFLWHWWQWQTAMHCTTKFYWQGVGSLHLWAAFAVKHSDWTSDVNTDQDALMIWSRIYHFCQVCFSQYTVNWTLGSAIWLSA